MPIRERGRAPLRITQGQVQRQTSTHRVTYDYWTLDFQIVQSMDHGPRRPFDGVRLRRQPLEPPCPGRSGRMQKPRSPTAATPRQSSDDPKKPCRKRTDRLTGAGRETARTVQASAGASLVHGVRSMSFSFPSRLVLDIELSADRNVSSRHLLDLEYFPPPARGQLASRRPGTANLFE